MARVIVCPIHNIISMYSARPNLAVAYIDMGINYSDTPGSLNNSNWKVQIFGDMIT